MLSTMREGLYMDGMKDSELRACELFTEVPPNLTEKDIKTVHMMEKKLRRQMGEKETKRLYLEEGCHSYEEFRQLRKSGKV